jgi:ribonucleoside-diphosphate reductase alpha chain
MGCGILFVTVNRDDKGICEVFANLGKAGGCPSQSEAICRAVSAALRSGIDPKVMIDQLGGIRCLSAAVARKANRGVDVLSCPDAIARALEEALGGANVTQDHVFVKKCPECGQTLRFESGCDVCDCGYSKCG